MKGIWVVVETKTGDIVSSHSTRRAAVMAARSYGRGFKVKLIASNPSRKRSTKKARAARARKTASVKRKANAAKKMLLAMNPGTKAKAVRIKRLKGGGVSITPVKVKVIR